MIELIDLDTGATMEVPYDKVYNHPAAGLQFSGEPTERALRAKEILPKYQRNLIRLPTLIKEGYARYNGVSLRRELYETKIIVQALQLMAEERR